MRSEAWNSVTSGLATCDLCDLVVDDRFWLLLPFLPVLALALLLLLLPLPLPLRREGCAEYRGTMWCTLPAPAPHMKKVALHMATNLLYQHRRVAVTLC